MLMENHNSAKAATPIADPKKPGRRVPPVEADDDRILNEDEQEEVLNAPDPDIVDNDGAAEKARGYAEGTKDDSLTGPEYTDSDDQPTFPGEETIT
jgi:hypothetical protein